MGINIFTGLIESSHTKEEKVEKSIASECRRLLVTANKVPKYKYFNSNCDYELTM
jgi:hypothetical protein